MGRNKILIAKLPLSIIRNTYRRKRQRIEIQGYKVQAKDDRYLNFIINGFRCNKCGIKGKYVNLECNSRIGNHLNVYGIDGSGKEVLLTKDHIYPKSKGGLDDIKNYQVLCERCNNNKKDISPIKLVEALRSGKATKESVEKAVKMHKPKALIGV